LPDATAEDQTVAKVVLQLLETKHRAKLKIDAEVAKRWCRIFIKDLDPRKNVFERGDVIEFISQASVLDDKIREGNLDFPRLVFDRYLKRIDERVATVIQLLRQKLDFKADDSILDDPDLYDYPDNADDALDRWRKKIKYEWLSYKVFNNLHDDEIVKKLSIVYQDWSRGVHQYDMPDLLEIYLSSLASTIDSSSSYLNARSFENLLSQQNLSLEGIGASLRIEDGFAVVTAIVRGSPSDVDGRLQLEDKIVGIQRENGTEIDLIGKKLSEVVRNIRGPRGTKVRLIVQPSGSGERRIYELTRQTVQLTEQHAKGQVMPAKGPNGEEVKIGVISLPTFYGDTAAIRRGDLNAVSATSDCRKILNDFKAKSVDAVIVDIRDNGGGLLDEAKTLSGLFVDTGPILQVRDATGIRHLDDNDDGTAWDGPMVVVTNHASASASEIFAGVIKDYGRGLIVGDSSTFGKGTVQSLEPIKDHLPGQDLRPLGALKLTIQQFYRVNGESTQLKGISPHIHIPSLRDETNFGEGKMDNPMKFDQVAALPHDDYHRVPADLIALLDTRSQERRNADQKFQKENERIKKYVARKARHRISLSEARFKAENGADEAGNDEDRGKLDNKNSKNKERSRWESDYYNDEIVRIVADYLRLGSKVLASAPERVKGGK